MRELWSKEGFAREWGSFLLITVFEIFFVGAALIQSKGMAFYKVHTIVDGHTYYHTEQVMVWHKILICMAIFWLLQFLLIGFSYKCKLYFSKVLCPIFLIGTVGIVFQHYAGSGGMKYFLMMAMGMAVMMVFCFLGTLTISFQSCKWICWLMMGLAIVNVIYGTFHKINGSGAWLSLFGISIQPGEIFKIFVVMYLAYAYIYIRDYAEIRKWFVITIVIQILALLLVKDLGNALILLFLCMMVVLPFYSKAIAIAGVVDVILLMYVLCAISGGLESWLGSSYLVQRFSTVFHVFELPEQQQYRQVLYGMLRGGMQGTGLADGVYTYSSMAYAATSDYAFLSVAAIFGVAVAMLVAAAIVMVVLNGSLSMTKHWELSHFCTGKIASAVLAIQVLFHVAGGLNIFPFSGVTFPFLSAGGSAMLTNFAIVGIILSGQVSCQQAQEIRWKLEEITEFWRDKVWKIISLRKSHFYQ